MKDWDFIFSPKKYLGVGIFAGRLFNLLKIWIISEKIPRKDDDLIFLKKRGLLAGRRRRASSISDLVTAGGGGGGCMKSGKF